MVTVIAAGLVVAVSSLVQGAAGYGMALIAAPLLAMIDPSLVPVPLILLTSLHAVLAVSRDWGQADWPGIAWALAGQLPGTVLGVLALMALSQRVFSLVIGLFVLACVVLSVLRWRPRPRPASLLVAGFASGVGSTVASIGGPPIALLYQSASGPRVRSTLAGYFILGSVTSIAALAGAGRITTASLASSALLLPFLLLGFLLSGPARRVLDDGWTRPAVLAVAAASALLLIGHAVLSGRMPS
ncbi:MAG TPA: sulfite exporter TauE/SafE family protein [Pseudonocardiaceae bacterium]|nr:sulfite exporter TauE/SafE family protein [Pseudonocardiaceae bacterium]